MVEVSEAYVVGLLADLQRELPRLEQGLGAAKKRAAAVGAELSQLVGRLDEVNEALSECKARGARDSLELTERNFAVASLHQEIAGLKRRSEDLKTEMDRVGPGAIHRRLRRERAKLSVQIEDREKAIQGHRVEVERLREGVQAVEEERREGRDRHRAIVRELDQLQSQLPSPHLYAQLFETTAAHAHCLYYLERDVGAWREQMRRAIAYMVELHRELRAGKYRLDKNSEIVGGRATATAEAIFASVAIDDPGGAMELFQLACDPGLFFHHIFNVFRSWALGLFLSGQTGELKTLLAHHQFAPGLRGGYVQTFIGLLARQQRRIASGLHAICRDEWEMWQDPARVRGAGVVNVGGLALAKLALEQGVAVRLPSPTIPDGLLTAPAG